MANFYTLVSHHNQDEGKRDDFYKTTQLQKKELSIGWGEVNPFGKKYDKIKSDIELHYPYFKGTTNPDNGGKSLRLFSDLLPGDIVFVRGNKKIIDVALITGKPFYDYNKGHDGNDYCTLVSFVPLFEDARLAIPTIDLPNDIYGKILYEGGVKLVMRKIEENVALQLLKMIFNH